MASGVYFGANASIANQPTYQLAHATIEGIVEDSLTRGISSKELSSAEVHQLTSTFMRTVHKLEGHGAVSEPKIIKYLHEGVFLEVDQVKALMLSSTLLGSGGECSVYLGVTDSGKRCAIKVMEDETHPAREQNILDALAFSPYVITRWGSDEWYRVEECCAYNLGVIVDEAELGNDAFAEFLGVQRGLINEQILIGIDDMHSKDICHLDVKLENILLKKKGAVRISDFGAAIFVGDVLRGGSVQWASPELSRLTASMPEKKEDRKVSDPKKVDIWQVGFALALLNKPLLSDAFKSRLEEYVTYHEDLLTDSQDRLVYAKKADEFFSSLGREGIFSDLAPENAFEKLLSRMTLLDPAMRPTSTEALEIYRNECAAMMQERSFKLIP